MQPGYIKIPVIEPHRQPSYYQPPEPESTAPEPTSPSAAYDHAYLSAAAQGRDSLVAFARKIAPRNSAVHEEIAREDREYFELGLLEDM